MTAPALPRPSIAEVVMSGQRRRKKRVFSAGVVVALAAHAGILLLASLHEDPVSTWAEGMRIRVARDLDRLQEISLDEEPVPPPVAPEPTPSPAPAPTQAAAPRASPAHATPPAAVRANAPSAGAPQAAEAAEVLAAPDDAVDFTQHTLVTGTGRVYAGGTTAAGGTSKGPVQGPVARAPSPAPRPAAAPAPPAPVPPAPTQEVDLSHPVTLSEDDWSCAWPREADREQIDEQSVVLQVRVDARGRVGDVKVLSDPGFGFGAAAQRCAYKARFTPALGRDGRPTQALSPPIRVHFFR